MPCIEITLPRVSETLRAALSEQLTRVFAESSRFEPELLGILFRQYEPGAAAVGGRLCGESSRPYLHLMLYCPRINRELKRALTVGFTAVFVEALGPGHEPTIHIVEHPYDNIGVNGQLLSDAYQECRERRFYYELSEGS